MTVEFEVTTEEKEFKEGSGSDGNNVVQELPTESEVFEMLLLPTPTCLLRIFHPADPRPTDSAL